MDLTQELQKIYDSEINVEIGWMWDGGIDIRLGDRMNGFLAEETVKSVAELPHPLQSVIAGCYPKSNRRTEVCRVGCNNCLCFSFI
jgi:hypothetical protein